MLDHFIFLSPLLILPIVALLRFVGCTPFGSTDDGGGVTVVLNPSSVDLGPGQSQQFTALVNGAASTDVIWSSNAPNGLFKAADPFTPGSNSATVTATSTTVATATGSASVNLKHVTISIAPPAAALLPGASQKFTATVQGSPDVNVTWTAADSSGLFTAPAPYVIGAPEVVTATSKADPSVSASASVVLIGNGAAFVKSDSTTVGGWKGIYGADGWLLAELPANLVQLPSYLPAFTAPPAVFTFADPTTDARGLQRPPAFTTRFAATWFDGNALTIELDFLDFQIHRVAAYFIDWDSMGRLQKIEILDNSQTPPRVLDTRSLSNFSGGQYLVWNLTGKVLLRITRTAGPNAVISGLFFE